MNGSVVAPLVGHSLNDQQGHHYMFTSTGLVRDDEPERTYDAVDAREVVTLIRDAMQQPARDDEDERALALAASAMGISPFSETPTRTMAPVIGETGPLGRALGALVREAREWYDRAAQELGLTLERAEVSNTTLVVRGDLPPHAISRLAGVRLGATLGAAPESWTIITPTLHEGDRTGLAEHIEAAARNGKLQAVQINVVDGDPVLQETAMSQLDAKALSWWLDPERAIMMIAQDPSALEQFKDGLTLPSAMVVDGDTQRQASSRRGAERSRERGQGMER